MTIITKTARRSTLCARTMDRLGVYFTEKDHHPSADHREALQDIAETMASMANGVCEPHVFLSSVDCGVGKSSTSMAFARALMNSPQHQHVGMLICVGRIAEAEAMAADLVDRHDRIAVLTHETAASWTPEALNGAQLLITTQQRIARVTDGRPFGDIETLRYLGAPRQVRVWDEAFLPGVAIALNDDSLGPLLAPARRLNPGFRHGLWSLMGTLEKSRTGDLVDIPDWPNIYGVTPYELLAAVAAEWRPQTRWRAAHTQADQQHGNENEEPIRDDQRMAVTSLFFLAGKTARVWRDNATGGAMLHYRDTLPDDLKPLLVLDASGRVRQTYADQERHRGLRRLRPAQKDYTPLTIHWWKRGGGKSSFKQGGAELAKGVAATIAARPTERWLAVIHRRDRRVGDVKAMILRELPREARPKVSFLTWGQHMATNEYADVPEPRPSRQSVHAAEPYRRTDPPQPGQTC